MGQIREYMQKCLDRLEKCNQALRVKKHVYFFVVKLKCDTLVWPGELIFVSVASLGLVN